MKRQQILEVLITILLCVTAASAQAQRKEIVIPDIARPQAENTGQPNVPLINRQQLLQKIRIDKVTGTIDLQAQNPTMAISSRLTNLSPSVVNFKIGIANTAEQNISLLPRGTTTQQASTRIGISQRGANIRSANISPQILLDKSLPISPVKEFSFRFVLPADAKRLIKSTKPLVTRDKTNGRLTYEWTGRDIYLTSVSVWWTTSETNLILDKSAYPNWQNRTVSISIKVRNNGTIPARNILLKENFPSQIYEEGSPSNGVFANYQGQNNDRRLLWQYSLPELAPGRETIVTYMLRIKESINVIRLFETFALEDNELIAMSEDIKIARN